MFVVESVTGQWRLRSRRMRVAQIAVVFWLLACYWLIAGQGFAQTQAKARGQLFAWPFGGNHSLATAPMWGFTAGTSGLGATQNNLSRMTNLGW